MPGMVIGEVSHLIFMVWTNAEVSDNNISDTLEYYWLKLVRLKRSFLVIIKGSLGWVLKSRTI